MPDKVRSLSIFVGTGECNARCAHCAGVPLRKDAPKHDGEVDTELVERVMRDCYQKGARSLSISSSGEPTLSPESVTKVLEIRNRLWRDKMVYNPVNLYSNGYRIVMGDLFRKTYLPLWKALGLITFYITVHSIDQYENAAAYGLEYYPPLDLLFGLLLDAGFERRANLILTKENFSAFQFTARKLWSMGVQQVSAWPIRDPRTDEVDWDKAPSKEKLDSVKDWCAAYSLQLHDGTNTEYPSGEKLTLFPDGTLSNSWCKS